MLDAMRVYVLLLLPLHPLGDGGLGSVELHTGHQGLETEGPQDLHLTKQAIEPHSRGRGGRMPYLCIHGLGDLVPSPHEFDEFVVHLVAVLLEAHRGREQRGRVVVVSGLAATSSHRPYKVTP